jgi:predicted DNA-binding transcriptional regulator AlpA/predicted GIY-YIG superfamily endonuclease
LQRTIVIRRTALYRHFDYEGRLLYIGVAYDPDQRWHTHASSTWRHLVDRSRTTIEWYESRELAEEAEDKAIAEEKPPHNKAARTRRPSYAPIVIPAPPNCPLADLLIASEVAEIVGVAAKSVHHMAKHSPTFPRPVMRKGAAPLWERKQVEAWRAAHPARHRKT